jgi:hypothetical protein
VWFYTPFYTPTGGADFTRRHHHAIAPGDVSDLLVDFPVDRFFELLASEWVLVLTPSTSPMLFASFGDSNVLQPTICVIDDDIAADVF